MEEVYLTKRHLVWGWSVWYCGPKFTIKRDIRLIECAQYGEEGGYTVGGGYTCPWFGVIRVLVIHVL